MALSITLTMKSIGELVEDQKLPFPRTDISHSYPKDQFPSKEKELAVLPSKRLSRFLQEEKTPSPHAIHQCHKNHKICQAILGTNSTACCNRKCRDLHTDKNHCGACKKKCEYTEECCRGKCVDLAYDKTHCGQCNYRCDHGEYCVYGLCNYP
ncbi:hypothetical protein CJ030_MR4G001387 [Morella rubra]|uniref:Stigma-specific STIG1-like protein 1 n=1 Tax=Morella rubra TaxID=262757 RepID=A0A6A1VQG9_9ROSI|nr:hypothetical protein CJ030_MR4G001387 [Morella rubra]